MPNPNPVPSKELLLEMFDYKDGELYRKPEKAGTIDGGGYVQTGIKGVYYKNHRLIFMMHHGYVPEFIDHIDGNKLNNRIENLRPATKSENEYNKKLKRKTFSGIKGITWRRDSKKWRAKITVDGKEITIGNYVDIEDAKQAIQKARADLHKQFANNG
jgi:hypothetical protein